MGQRPALHLVAGMAGRIEGRDGRGRHHHPVIAVAQVGDGMQDTNIGADADHRDLLWLGGEQPGFQVGLEEAGVAALADQGGALQQWLELGDHLRLGRPAHAVHREDLELAVVRVVGVGQEDQLVAGLPAGFDHVADARDRGIAAR